MMVGDDGDDTNQVMIPMTPSSTPIILMIPLFMMIALRKANEYGHLTGLNQQSNNLNVNISEKHRWACA